MHISLKSVVLIYASGLLFLTACSSNAETVSDDAGTDASSNADAGQDAGEELDSGACPVGERLLADGQCGNTIAWSESAGISPGRDHHVTWIYDSPSGGPHLYIGGGTDTQGDFTGMTQVYMAEIHADGSLGAFVETTAFPYGMAGAAVAMVNDVVVIAGGITHEFAPVDVYRLFDRCFSARIAADGSISAWIENPEMNHGRFHFTMVAHDSNLVAVGGSTGTTSLTSVELATVNDDGTVSEWRAGSALDESRSHHVSVVHGNYVYVSGGLHGSAVSPTNFLDVIRASIDADGTISAWEEAGRTPVHTTSSAFVRGDAYYILGGVNLVGFTNKVLRASFDTEGNIGEFIEVAESLPLVRGHVHHTPLFNDYIYSYGGTDPASRFRTEMNIGHIE